MKYLSGKESNRDEITPWQGIKFKPFNPWLLTNDDAGSSQGFVIKVVPTPPFFSMISDRIYFLFFFSFNNVRGRFREVLSMNVGFLIWSEKVSMKHIVYLPLGWKSKFVHYRSHDFFYFEGSFM